MIKSGTHTWPLCGCRPLRRVTHVNDTLLSNVTLGGVKKVSFPCKDVRTYTHIGSRDMVIDTVNEDVEMFVYTPRVSVCTCLSGGRHR